MAKNAVSAMDAPAVMGTAPDAATMMEKSSIQVAPPGTLVPGVPPAVDRLVAAAMSWDPAGRPQSAEAFKAALNDAVRSA